MATPEEFERAVQRWWKYWVGVAVNQGVGSYEEACDIVQVVLEEIFPKLAYVDTARTSLKTFIARATRFRVIDFFRSVPRRDKLRVDLEPDPDANPEGRTEFWLRFEQALKQMTPMQQRVHRLYYQEDLDQREIGKFLGISQPRVSEILHAERPVRLLREQFSRPHERTAATPTPPRATFPELNQP